MGSFRASDNGLAQEESDIGNASQYFRYKIKSKNCNNLNSSMSQS